MTIKRRWLVLALVLAILAWALTLVLLWPKPEPPPPAPLPPDAVHVEPVRVIEPTRPGAPRVVERVTLRTVEAPVPEATVRALAEALARDMTERALAERAADLGPVAPGVPPASAGVSPAPLGLDRLPDLAGRVSVTARKLEGTVDGDELRWGWTGTGSCDVRIGEGPWLPIVDAQPISVEGSSAVSVLRPEQPRRRWSVIPRELRIGIGTTPSLQAGATWYGPRRIGWWVQGRYQLDADLTYVPEAEAFRALEQYELAGGLSLRIGKR